MHLLKIKPDTQLKMTETFTNKISNVEHVPRLLINNIQCVVEVFRIKTHNSAFSFITTITTAMVTRCVVVVAHPESIHFF